MPTDTPMTDARLEEKDWAFQAAEGIFALFRNASYFSTRNAEHRHEMLEGWAEIIRGHAQAKGPTVNCQRCQQPLEVENNIWWHVIPDSTHIPEPPAASRPATSPETCPQCGGLKDAPRNLYEVLKDGSEKDLGRCSDPFHSRARNG